MAIKNKAEINDEARILFSLQNNLHDCLYQFMNGLNQSKYLKLFYPLLDYVRNDLQTIFSLRQFLISKFNYNLTKIPFKNLSFLSSREYAKFLSKLFIEFYDLNLERFIIKKVQKNPPIDFNSWQSKIQDKSYFKPIFNLQKQIKNSNFFKLFALHGSLSTLDYVKGWSDVDTFGVIKKEIICSPEHLLKCRKLLVDLTLNQFLIDPLQHHGFFIFAEQELDFYSESFLPLVVLDKAVSFLDASQKSFLFKIRDSSLERKELFFEYYNYFQDIFTKKRILRNKFEWKGFFSSFSLFPAIFYQSKGNLISKKEALIKAKKEFNSYSSLFARVYDIRKTWPSSKLGVLKVSFNPPLYFLKARLLSKKISFKDKEFMNNFKILIQEMGGFL